ncbi:pyrimidine (deoxy)nucleoside triphosphate pyrophosphohydrolase [compost metagenome]
MFPGGQVEAGENLIEALIREIKEESGIDTEVSHLIGVYSNTATYKWHDGVTDVPTKVMLDYICKPVGGQLSTSDETSDSRWVAKDTALEMITSPAIRTRFQAYLEFAGNVAYIVYETKPEFQVAMSRKI